MKRQMELPEKECPECGGPINWKVIYGPFGMPLYNGICTNCNIILKGRETPDITKGRALARNGEIDGTLVKDMKVMDKRITSLPCDVQLGLLRELQHGSG